MNCPVCHADTVRDELTHQVFDIGASSWRKKPWHQRQNRNRFLRLAQPVAWEEYK